MHISKINVLRYFYELHNLFINQSVITLSCLLDRTVNIIQIPMIDYGRFYSSFAKMSPFFRRIFYCAF